MKKKKKRVVASIRAIFLVVVMVITGLNLGDAGVVGAVATPASNNASIVACAINADKTTVSVVANAPGLPASDDGLYYLFEEPTFSAGLTGTYVAAVPRNSTVTFTFDLLKNQAGSRLYKKFAVATKQGGQWVQLSTACYITNPEAIATKTMPRTVTNSKKGLHIDPSRLLSNELTDLGVQHAAYNIPVANILGPTTNASYPTINYTYNGKAYQFNGLVVAEYDFVFSNLSRKGISTTAILLNNYSPAYLNLIHPLSRDGSVCPYYAFNAADASGVEYLAAIGSFLAQRYNGADVNKGKVDNWVVGNEVTARTQWNYISSMSLEAYVEEYAKAVRLFYTAIKSENANANVLISIDQQWDRNRGGTDNYDGKDLVYAFNNNIRSKGNIDWGIACHPHPVPLTWAPFWALPANYARMNLVTHAETSKFLTMQNIEVITDMMCKPELISSTGQVRNIYVTEAGYTSTQGQEYQAAAFTYGYLQAAYNQYIDAFIVSNETDSAAEIPQGLAFGVTNMDGSHKLVYDYYKYINTANAQAYMDNARAIIGISDWGQVIFPR